MHSLIAEDLTCSFYNPVPGLFLNIGHGHSYSSEAPEKQASFVTLTPATSTARVFYDLTSLLLLSLVSHCSEMFILLSKH